MTHLTDMTDILYKYIEINIASLKGYGILCIFLISYTNRCHTVIICHSLHIPTTPYTTL